MAKNIKKLFALILAVSMVMSLSVNAFAADSIGVGDPPLRPKIATAERANLHWTRATFSPSPKSFTPLLPPLLRKLWFGTKNSRPLP